jgi:hypothetical protein
MNGDAHADGHSSCIALAVEATDILAPNGHSASAPPEKFVWTPRLAILSIFLFVVAGVAEIGGGWLIFQTVRVQQPFWWAIVGAFILVIYGFIPTFQPISNFGRVFAVYGG